MGKCTTWLPEIGTCESVYTSFSLKSKRDYFASQASKIDGYIKHNVGQFVTKNGKETVYYCLVYTYIKEYI